MCATNQKRSKNQPKNGFGPIGIIALIIGIVIVFVALGFAVSHWSQVARERKLKNPVPPTPAALADAKQLYQLHCQRCHGVSGDGHGEKAPELSVAPGDFADVSKMRTVADGELYWQITYGRLPMPAFKDKINEEGRWALVDYIRTFAEKTPAHSTTGAPSAKSTPKQ
ncbi:MAG: c-type cytochrome [Candidatus Acidiferrales bacterium]